MGVLHRFLTVDEQATQVEQVAATGSPVAAAVGINEDYIARSAALAAAGVDALVVDVAHGHLERTITAVETIADEFPDVDIVAGNVATPAGVEDLAAAGADCVKVGIGPGLHCTTRKVAGAGVPQLTAVDDCATAAEELDVTICADGGIRTSGDAVKALMAGADTVMLGSLFAGTEEAPGAVVKVDDGTQYKRSRGMATTAAAEDRDDKGQMWAPTRASSAALTPYKGPGGDRRRGVLSGDSLGAVVPWRPHDRNALATGQNSSASHPARRSARGPTPTTTGRGSAWTARRSESPTRTAKRRPKAATDYRAGAERRIRLDDRPGCERVTVCRSHGALLTPSGHPLRMPDAFGRAIRDHHRGDRTTPPTGRRRGDA